MKTSGRNLLIINLSFLLKVRILNIIMLIFAMYISAIYIFGEHQNPSEILKNIKLHGIIISSAFSAMAGYIINFFYDKEKDNVYRPFTTTILKFINLGTDLKIYIAFNLVSLTISLFLSYRIFIFFLVYQFLIWFYSHKLSKIVFINNLTNSILMIFPFLALFLFYENFSIFIIYLAVFLFLCILIRDICKDLHSYKYDDLFDYNTLPNTLGIIPTKLIINLLLIILIVISFHLTFDPQLSNIKLYYLLTSLLSFIIMIGIWFIKRSFMQILILIIKFWIFLGTISLLFIDENPLPLYLLKYILTKFS